MKRIFNFAPILLALSFTPAAAWSQTFDTSGTGLLTGTWFVRYVAFDNLTTAGTIGRARSVTGTFTFDGSGNYTLTGQLSDNTVNSGAAQALSVTGNYQVSASGLLELINPLDSSQTVFGGIGTSAFVGSSTESSIIDMMVAVPVGSTVSNSSLSGPYWVGAIDYPGGDITKSMNALFEINADGQGNLGALSVLGHSAALSNDDLTTPQSITGATYALRGTTGTLTLPLASGATAQSQLISGTKQFFVSSDGNILVGGSLTDYDMIVGIRAGTGTLSNSTFNGIYYTAGTDSDLSQASSNNYGLDGYYGSLHANGAGTVIAHQRINPSYSGPYDYTADDEVTVSSTGNVDEAGADQYYVGANGNAVVLIGSSTTYSLELSIAPRTTNPGGAVVLNPLGIVNTANYAPITNPVAPGEYIDLFGTGLAGSTAEASSLPFPGTLGGVSVSINGVNAPLYIVSPTEIVCLVPYATTQTYATIQVTNNGVTSNAVTLYTEQSAPGAFTLGQDGIGPGAFLHASGAVVSDSSPANVGETIEAFLTGLGAVSPGIGDGTAAPANSLTVTEDQFSVYVDGTQATVNFAGLAPGFAGLYQVNFVVPGTPDTGEVYVDFEDSDFGAYNSMATMAVSNVTATTANPALRGGRTRRNQRRLTCQENFGATNASPTRGNCGSAGRTGMAGRNLQPRSVGTSPSRE